MPDRWHLLKNVREMLERFLERHRGEIRSAAAQLPQPLTLQGAPRSPAEELEAKHAQAEAAAATGEPTTSEPPTGGPRSFSDRRQERFEAVRRRHADGESIRQIGKEIGLSRGAVRRYLRQGHCPDWRPGQARLNRLDRFQPRFDEQIQSGQLNAAEMHQQLAGRGHQGGYNAVRRFVSRRLAALGQKREEARQRGEVPAPARPFGAVAEL